MFPSSPQSIAAQRFSAGLFWYATDGSLLTDGVYRNRTNDRQVVGCNLVARAPRRADRDAGEAGIPSTF